MKESTNYFSHGIIAKNISDLFLNHKSNSSFVIAINGEWGTGKTHLMNNVLSTLNNVEYVKVSFNAWRYSKKDDIWRSLLICILAEFKAYVNNKELTGRIKWHENEIERINQLIDDTERALYTAFIKEIPGEISLNTNNLLKTGLNVALKFVPWGNIGSEMVDKLLVKKNDEGGVINPNIEKADIEDIFGIFSRSTTKRSFEKITGVEQFRLSFENLMKCVLEGDICDNEQIGYNRDLRLIVAIDDLDRCLPENALEVLEAIKLFIDCPNTFFMIAMDGKIIQQGLNIRYSQYNFFSNMQAKDYYEKMIDLSLNIPALLDESFYNYIKSKSKYSESYLENFQLFSMALNLNLRAWERYIYRADFNRGILERLTNEKIFEDKILLNVFLKIQCFSYQWPELFRKLNDYDTYIEIEKKAVDITNYDCKMIDVILDELNSIKTLSKEFQSAITEKKIIDFIRKEPLLSKVNKKNQVTLFFTFDMALHTN